jgi:hypothetical protein
MGDRLFLSDGMKSGIRAYFCPKIDGEHHVELCPMCASPRWRSTFENRAPDVVATEGNDVCDECDRFRTLHPEVFRFVHNALSGQRMLAKLRVPKATAPSEATKDELAPKR